MCAKKSIYKVEKERKVVGRENRWEWRCRELHINAVEKRDREI